MQNVYQVAQGIVKFGKDIDPNLFKKNLPAGFYTTAVSQGQIFLNQADPLKIPAKIYGDSTERMNRIITSFKATDKNLGVLLYGESGSGKSLLAKQVCVELSSEHPVIIVLPEHIEIIGKYIESIDDRCVFFIDEFEKMFEKAEHQDALLSIIDGTSSKSNLFLFTANEKNKINRFFFNRPGRIRYVYEYESLPDNTVLEILKDVLNDKNRVEEISMVISYLKEPSFDVVCSIAQEANLYPHFTIKQLMYGYNSELYSEELGSSNCRILINGCDFIDCIKNIFTKHGMSMQYFNYCGATNHSALDLKEISLTNTNLKESINLIDYSFSANYNGKSSGNSIYLYFDISKMDLTVKGRNVSINNIRFSLEEIEDTVDSILCTMKDLNEKLPEIAKQELIELFSQHDIKLISKPVKRIRLNPFNVF